MTVLLFIIGSILLSACTAEISFRRAGWLDRVVEYQKGKFLDEFSKVVPIEVKIQDAPPGYQDSKDWDFDSVSRLLKLIYSTESAKPVQLMLGEALQTSFRRYQLSPKSLMQIPSLAASHPGFFYDYVDHKMGGDFGPPDQPWQKVEDDDILFISNPVEAQIPSRHISVGLLKDILMQRALQSRQLPTKPPKTIIWKPTAPIKKQPTTAKHVTTPSVAPDDDTDSTTPEGAAQTTSADDGDSSDKATAADQETTASGGDTGTDSTTPAGNDAEGETTADGAPLEETPAAE